MIKTANGKEIDYQTLKQKLENAVNSEVITNNPVKIDCYQQNDSLAITVAYERQSQMDFAKITAIIKQVLAETGIIRPPIISWVEINPQQESILEEENDSQEYNNIMEISSDEDEDIEYQEDENELEMPEVSYQTAELEEEEEEENEDENNQQSKKLFVGWMALISGLILLGAGAACLYYFTRPCAVGQCQLIPDVKTQVDSSLQQIDQDTNISELQNIQATINESKEELNKIPPFSKSYDSAQNLITQYDDKNNNIDKIIQSLKLGENANDLVENAPLEVTEWQKIIDFWQEAINILKTIKTPEFNSFTETKINNYQAEINQASQKIELEKTANNLLNEAQKTAQEVEEKTKTANSLSDLRNLAQNWVSVINKVENISGETTSFEEKDTLLNNYLDKLLVIRNRIKQEESAEKILTKAQENINLAKEWEGKNQWTRAVSYWTNAVQTLQNIPQDTFFTEELNNLKSDSEKRLDTAKIQLKLAVTRENIKNDLEKICSTSDNICTYSVTNEVIKVFINNSYLENVARISSQPSVETQQLLEQHINQVEKNYQYISSKYRRPLEVYNPQNKLIFRYK